MLLHTVFSIQLLNSYTTVVYESYSTVVWIIGQIQYSYAVWLCSMVMQYGYAVWLCSMVMQYGYAVWLRKECYSNLTQTAQLITITILKTKTTSFNH